MTTIPTHTERHPLLQLAADMPAMPNAACCRVDPELFHVHDSQHEEIAAAKQLCATCPELEVCRDWVLANPSLARHGVWAGMTEKERHRIRRRNEPAERRRRKR